jgi:hypothetical protein
LRTTERLGELNAMAAELYHAWTAMKALTETRPLVLAPLYHLPLTTFERALPKLIGEASLTDNEIAGLIEYVMRAEELNRGLDLASTVAATGGEEASIGAIKPQYDRNVGKVQHILHEKQEHLGGLTVFETAECAIYRLMGDMPPDRYVWSASVARGIAARRDRGAR